MSKVSHEEARQIAREQLKRELDADVIHSVDVEELSTGYKVKIEVDKPLIGMGSIFITDSGEVKSYPSSLSPRMAEEEFLSGK